ncbi:hypothetical protein [uncultured Corynebacterium sp.]|uniref:hypothetical protein n=1 Tax=uncultured Corynebacterium sp. TaxID=159447 RepID=UPI0025F03BD8|nr:hypothetical protein [uncultured Corynebacterium sp.]
MRPQELYHQVGMTHEGLRGIADQVRQLVAAAEVWDPERLTVDDSSVITPADAAAAVAEDLRACADALDLAVGHVEAAWSASSRIGDSG